MAGNHYPDRILSLAPSTTAILDEMDATNRLVGVTDHCTYQQATSTGNWLDPDYQTIYDLDADLILTSGEHQTDITAELRRAGYTVYHTSPRTLTEVIDSFVGIADAVGLKGRGESLAWDFQTQISHLRTQLADKPNPTVYTEKWSNPPKAAGHWVPDLIALAGGDYPFVAPGNPPREVPPDELLETEPDHILLQVYGANAQFTAVSASHRAWIVDDLQDTPIHIVNDRLLSQPSPRLLEGVKEIAKQIHPSVSFSE